jgi:hypothetical protein
MLNVYFCVVVCDGNRWRCVLLLTVVMGTVVYIRICWS